MQLLVGLLVLLVFQCLGEAAKIYFGWNIPGPVIGMSLLFISLCLYKSSPKQVTLASQSLIPLLGLMFLPASAGLFFLDSSFNNQWPAILCAVVLGSILSLVFNSVIVKWLMRHKTNESANNNQP